jgi:hypothetical protein
MKARKATASDDQYCCSVQASAQSTGRGTSSDEVSLLVGGLLAAAIGIQAVYALGGALLLLAAAIGWAGARPAAARPDLSDPAKGEDESDNT